MTKQQPLVSVIIPCYNHEQFVQETIKSIIGQDYKNIELIIIDDGSKDNSVEAIQKMIEVCKERFVRFNFIHRPNKGLCITLNEAIDWCLGDFLAIFASDDIMYQNRISAQIAVFLDKINEEPNLVGIYSGVEYIDYQSKYIRNSYGANCFYGFHDVARRKAFIPSPTLLVLRKAIIQVGGYNNVFKVEDLYMILKLADAGGVYYSMKEVLVKYRRHSDNLSKKSDLILEEVTKILDQYKERADYNEIKAASLMVQAHDYQLLSNLKGISYLLKALSLDPKQLFSKSIIKFLVKIVYNPHK